MFRLDEALAAWRAVFGAGSALSPEQLEELESHIEEAFYAGVARGQEPATAFEEALTNVGTHHELEREYRKLKPLRQQLFEISRAVYVTFILFVFGFTAVFVFKTGYAPMALNRIGNSVALLEIVVFLAAFLAPVAAFLIAFSYLKSNLLKYLAIGTMLSYILSSFSVIGPSLLVMMTFRGPTLVLLASFLVTGKRLLYLVVFLSAIYFIYCSIAALDTYVAILNTNPQRFAFNVLGLVSDILLSVCMAIGLSQREMPRSRATSTI